MKKLISTWKNNHIPPPDPEKMENFARQAAQLAGLPDFDWNCDIEFTDDQLMIRRNMELLGHEGTTDVITFSYFSGDEDDIILEGETAVDVVINADAAAREGAKRKNSSYARELALYIVHAMLHSTGMEDHTPEERRRMRYHERRILSKLDLFI